MSLGSDSSPSTATRLGPFVGLTVVALLLSAPVGRDGASWVEYGVAWLAMVAVGIGTLFGTEIGDGRLGPGRALLYLAGVAVLREATGGANGGVGTLVMVPVVWTALYGTSRQLKVTIAGVALTWVIPLVLIGAPRYPVTGWRSAVLIVSLATIIGTTVQRLVAETRAQATRARDHLRDREQLLATVNQLARTDALTGTANRRSWDERFADELAAASGPVSIAILDLDRFKQLNDAHGHEAGDRCLKESAAGWAAQLRPHDLLARIGGDEFAVLLPECPLEPALAVAQRLRAATHGTSCSIGVAQWDGHETPARLRRRADAALYADKRRTRGSAERRAPTSDRPQSPLANRQP